MVEELNPPPFFVEKKRKFSSFLRRFHTVTETGSNDLTRFVRAIFDDEVLAQNAKNLQPPAFGGMARSLLGFHRTLSRSARHTNVR